MESCHLEITGQNSRKRKRKRPRNSVSRGRPHPNDFNFPISFPFSRPRGIRVQRVLYALAMSWHRPRDRTRLQMLKNMHPDTLIISVSDCDHTQGSMLHIACNFSSIRGRKSLTRSVTQQRRGHHCARILIYLDYFWLQANYYRYRYGMCWLSSTADILLRAGADEVILPYDGGWSNAPSGSNMEQMLNGELNKDCTIDFIQLQDSLLWMASNQAETIAADNNGDNMFQTHKFLHPQRPFLLVRKRTP